MNLCEPLRASFYFHKAKIHIFLLERIPKPFYIDVVVPCFWGSTCWHGFDFVDFQFLLNQVAEPSGNPCQYVKEIVTDLGWQFLIPH